MSHGCLLWRGLVFLSDGCAEGKEDQEIWRNLRHSLVEKYGCKYGGYIYYKRFAAYLLDSITKHDAMFSFSDGGEYRLRITYEKWYRDVVQEHFVDLGGWVRLEDKTYKVLRPEKKWELEVLV